jgi:hypothetical protein
MTAPPIEPNQVFVEAHQKGIAILLIRAGSTVDSCYRYRESPELTNLVPAMVDDFTLAAVE